MALPHRLPHLPGSPAHTQSTARGRSRHRGRPLADGVDHAAQTVDADALISALDALPKDQAAVVLLVDGEGLSYAEAAAVLDVRAGTIASRLNRAHIALRTALDEGGSRS